ncbi:MAG: hypothetical protein WC758_07680 [Candidatus Woesearchaeota archaeon]|jgi:hypothetical protein
MKFTIVPELINSKHMHFYDERDIEIFLCEETDSNYVNQFQTPFIVINKFAQKTTKKEDIVILDINELKVLDYVVVAIQTSRGYQKRQRVIYRLESKSNISPGSRKIDYVPTDHKVEKDIPNKRIRIVGPNAGPNGFGSWNDIK